MFRGKSSEYRLHDRMVDFTQETKVLHLEPTTVCNAKCPQCSREDINLYDDTKNRNELTLTKCKELFSKEFIQNLDKMFMCGVFGDPASTKEAIEIYKYFRECNPCIVLGMNTNGSIRGTKWWAELAQILNHPQDFVVFSIDGLKDTNHLYRIGVNYEKVISNAQTFIDNGGHAHWDMLVFEHNQHQVNEAENLAKKMGFKWFRCKVSKRFNSRNVENLNPPSTFELPNINRVEKINCLALKDKSLYVTASGRKLPCCWIGPYDYNTDNYLRELIESKNWEGLINSWKSNPHDVCSRTCGVGVKQKGSFENQWTKETELN